MAAIEFNLYGQYAIERGADYFLTLSMRNELDDSPISLVDKGVRITLEFPDGRSFYYLATVDNPASGDAVIVIPAAETLRFPKTEFAHRIDIVMMDLTERYMDGVGRVK